MIKILFYLVVLVDWWAICFWVNIFIYKRLPRTYLPPEKKKVRILTYSFPVVAMLFGGLMTKNLVIALIFVSTIVQAVILDIVDGFNWAMYETQIGILD
jgi:Na+/melibiose symporter-like transporter